MKKHLDANHSVGHVQYYAYRLDSQRVQLQLAYTGKKTWSLTESAYLECFFFCCFFFKAWICEEYIKAHYSISLRNFTPRCQYNFCGNNN